MVSEKYKSYQEMIHLTPGFSLCSALRDVSKRQSQQAGWSSDKSSANSPRNYKWLEVDVTSGHQGISAVIATQMITILQKWFINITPHPQQKGKTRESLEHKAKCGYRLNVQVLIVSDSQPYRVILTKQGPREYSVT